MAEIIQIDANTWRLEDGFVRFFLLVGDDMAALIDSGADCPDAANITKTLTDKPIMLINTHGAYRLVSILVLILSLFKSLDTSRTNPG